LKIYERIKKRASRLLGKKPIVYFRAEFTREFVDFTINDTSETVALLGL